MTLEIGWDLLADLPEEEMKRITPKMLKAYHPHYHPQHLTFDDPDPE
jgi:vacuolar-type H+-ATPase subunit B/Vma2